MAIKDFKGFKKGSDTYKVKDERADNLGTASAKNSTSVVTNSSDLVESGAVKDIVGWGNKNLLPNNLESRTKNTVVITVNNDKSVKLNGTPTSNDNVALCDLTNSDLPSGNYILSSVLHSNNKFIKAEAYNGSTFVSMLATTQSGDNQEFAVDWNGYNTITVSICLLTTATYNNETFYPMIRLASITDDTYEPYHASVEQTLRDAEVVQGKNLLPNNATSQTLNGVSFTVNSDGSITANGTATANAYYTINRDVSIKTGTIVNGCPSGGSTNGFALLVASYDGSTAYAIDEGKGVVINNDVTNAWVFIRVRSGVTVSNKVFYPMISAEGGAYEPYYIPLKDVVPNKCDNSVIAPVENGDNASQAYAVEQHFIRDGAFCTCIQAIAQGGTFTLNTNYTAGDVASILNGLIKSDTFSGTTNANGNISITNITSRRVIKVESNDKIGLLYAAATYVGCKILSATDLTPVVNTNVNGTYYYI